MMGMVVARNFQHHEQRLDYPSEVVVYNAKDHDLLSTSLTYIATTLFIYQIKIVRNKPEKKKKMV